MTVPNPEPSPATSGVRPPITGRSRRRTLGFLLGILTLIALGTGTAVLAGFLPNPVIPGTSDVALEPAHRKAAARSVQVIRPKLDTSIGIRLEQLAEVEPYYQADLRARVSGIVKSVYKDIGDRVHQGELLLVIDVPELDREVAQKAAVITQRLQEVAVARSGLMAAEAKRDVAEAVIKQREAELVAAQAARDLRKQRLERYQTLAARAAIGPDVIDEQMREVKASSAAVDASSAAVQRAFADLKDANSTVTAAHADIQLKQAMVQVAREDHARSAAIAGYTRIVAPFDGVVVRRTVDPGSFVQNATTGTTEPLISVARTDLITVVARVPDVAAPFLSENTRAVITVNELPGVRIEGKVSRFTPAVRGSDRTIRVEVDLFNGDDSDRQRIVDRVVSSGLIALGVARPLSVAAGLAIEERAEAGTYKGDPLPPPALPHHTPNDHTRIVPGMLGSMSLVLHDFGGASILPSTAVYTRAGQPYVMLIENDEAHQYPVRIQVDDGRIALVSLITNRRDADGHTRQRLSALTGYEQIIASRQLELMDGQPVTPVPTEW
ncbi:MAG: efflux RND transporter periplasmic adaptor subunit [Bacteroidales bacterium]|nr:efflux RND transporter periplasmic adaptor subunit [Bacteroidales bacterium]